jgi:ribosomal protein S18 acetylase RimI-like enzyme
MGLTEAATAPGRRASVASDGGFLYVLYSSTRDEEMALWNAPADQREAFMNLQFTAQRAHYTRYYPRATNTIITLGDQPVGRSLVDRSNDEIHVIDIALLPEYRNTGLGTTLMRELLDESVATGRAVRLHVFKPSRAVQFYERLGFRKIGDAQTHWRLEWNPLVAAGNQ